MIVCVLFCFLQGAGSEPKRPAQTHSVAKMLHVSLGKLQNLVSKKQSNPKTRQLTGVFKKLLLGSGLVSGAEVL